MNTVVHIDEEKRIECAKCVNMCPRRILYIDDKSGKCRVADETKCDCLAGCEWVCPVQAITIQSSQIVESK